MSKTKKDKSHREYDRKFSDGGYKRTENSYEQRNEKRMRNLVRSNNVDDIMEAYYSNT